MERKKIRSSSGIDKLKKDKNPLPVKQSQPALKTNYPTAPSLRFPRTTGSPWMSLGKRSLQETTLLLNAGGLFL